VRAASGTPVNGYASLTNGQPGPVPLVFQRITDGQPYVFAPNELVYIVSYVISSNDVTSPLVTLDDGITGGAYITRKMASVYGSHLNPVAVPSPTGVLTGRRGVAPRASASAITAGKTVEVVIVGYVSRT